MTSSNSLKLQRRRRVLTSKDGDPIAHFIECVKRRPPLYNYQLPQQERRRADVARIWQELADELGNTTAAECRKKWKNLRDTYHQYRLRRSKFRDCFERWRYTKHLSFLLDIYQPKLKSERGKYKRLIASENNDEDNKMIGMQIDSIIESDNDDTQISMNEDTLIENDYDENVEHVIDIKNVQFCEVKPIHEIQNVSSVENSIEENSYEEVCLYDDTEPSQIESKAKQRAVNPIVIRNSFDDECSTKLESSKSEYKDELDLFFQFLKSKIQNLPSVDRTEIQIEFLNAVLRKEAANAKKLLSEQESQIY